MARDERFKLMGELLLFLAKNANIIKIPKLTTFAPMKGHKSNGELMVIGRALNGWGKGWPPVDNLDTEFRNNILKCEFGYSENKEKCPMAWVSTLWGGNGDYNTKKSAFWRVVNKITDKLEIDNSLDWPSHLIWSNLYKVSPREGGNPGSRLAELQRDICLKLLKLEIEEWAPKRILMITGLDYWAKPFIDYLEISPCAELSYHYVELVGNYKYENGMEARVVVTKRPESQGESIITGEIVNAFS